MVTRQRGLDRIQGVNIVKKTNRIKACQAVIDQERYIASHDYSGYDRPTYQSNGSTAVYQSDIQYLRKLKKTARMI